MSYRMVVGRSAEKSLRRCIPPELAVQVRLAIGDLAADPRPRGAVKMRGTEEQEEWRVRVGDYRIVYRVDDEAR
ncbi:MAG: type II toxin-antitoxin system RelE family toxin, partial [Rubrobacter sp.]